MSSAFLRYAIIGGLATAGHYLLLLVLVETGSFSAPPAAAMGAVFGALIAYLGNRRYTFSDTTRSHSWALPRFLLVAAIGAAFNAAMVWSGMSLLGLHYMLAQVVATLVAMIGTFMINRSWTFK